MPFLPTKTDQNDLFFDESELRRAAQSIAKKHRENDPFPHTVIDNFLPDWTLDKVLEHFPSKIDRERSRSQELFKGAFPPEKLTDAFTRNLFYLLNAQPFLSFLEELTGIDGLIPDPYFLGGGLHETINGGNLGIHADFSLHKKLRLRRRINVLIYLNKDWKDEFGGNLELWSKDMKQKIKSVAPVFNRCVIFNTTSTSFHGHPEPLSCPENRSRKSIALYYYTASDAIFYEEKVRTTVFKKRPNTGDKFDYYIRGKYFVRDLIPPILTRTALRIFKGKGV